MHNRPRPTDHLASRPLTAFSVDGYRRMTSWSLLAIVVLFGVIGIAAASASADTAGFGVILAAAIAATLGAGALAWWWDHPIPLPAFIVSLVLAAGVVVAANAAGATPAVGFATLMPLAMFAGCHRPWWPSLAAGVLVIWGGGAMIAAAHGAPVGWQEAITLTVFFGAQLVVVLGINLGWQFTVRIDQHRADQNELALTRERLRFASDLHDIQGHTLLAIKLKAELARRSLNHDAEVTRRELADIERLVADASAQTRQLADGYRALPLSAELANLDALLTATGMSVDIEHTGTGDGHPPEFSFLIREAVSNILRHAAPTHVHVAVTPTSITIANDGARNTPADENRPGSGLAGLQRRFLEAGGTLSWEHDGEWFHITGTKGATA